MADHESTDMTHVCATGVDEVNALFSTNEAETAAHLVLTFEYYKAIG